MPTPSRRLRILVLDPFPPRLDARHGGARTTAELALALAEKHDVTLLCLRDGTDPPADPELAHRGIAVTEIARPAPRWLPLALGLARGRPSWVSAWDVPAMRAALAERVAAWRPDLLQLEFHVMGQYLDVLSRGAVPALLVAHEPGADASEGAWRDAPWPKRPLLGLEWIAWRRYERRLHASVDAVVAFSERDRRAITRLAPSARVRIIAPSIRVPETPRNPRGTSGPALLFFGSFRHPPNREAAERLVERILPKVREHVPEATLTIVGERPPAKLVAAAGPGLRVLDAVPNLDPHLDEAAIVVVPLRSGGGVRIKVLHALAAGKAIVASPLAVEGIAGDEPPPIRVADRDEELVTEIVRLLRDAEERTRLAESARAWAVRNLGWRRVVERYEELYEELLRAREEAATR